MKQEISSKRFGEAHTVPVRVGVGRTSRTNSVESSALSHPSRPPILTFVLSAIDSRGCSHLIIW
jgi:hypothetical protein